MKSMRYIALLFLLICLIGCAQKDPGKKVLARVNNYEISKEEFEQEFKASIFGAGDTPQGRREFLNHLIDQKLILQDAQERGLDKTRGFLGAIENFWEQTLLRTALEQKIEELAGSFSVTDEEIRSLYTRRIESGYFNTTFEKAAPLLRREISKNKETQALSAWIDGLHKKAKIQVNEEALK